MVSFSCCLIILFQRPLRARKRKTHRLRSTASMPMRRKVESRISARSRKPGAAKGGKGTRRAHEYFFYTGNFFVVGPEIHSIITHDTFIRIDININKQSFCRNEVQLKTNEIEQRPRISAFF